MRVFDDYFNLLFLGGIELHQIDPKVPVKKTERRLSHGGPRTGTSSRHDSRMSAPSGFICRVASLTKDPE